MVFPGQGCQKVGMARDFAERYAESAEIFDRASDALKLNMRELCFEPSDLLDKTEFTQPAILTAEIAILAALNKHYAVKPQYFAGHSLGEYSALVAADVFKLEDAVQIVRQRGALMQSAVPQGIGAMAALIMAEIPEDQVKEICKEHGSECANFNSSDQIVISGEKNAVELSCQALASRFAQMRIIALNVSAPFHSSLMRPIEGSFKQFLTSFAERFNLSNCNKVLSNFSGTYHTADTLVSALVDQISGPVRWVDNMKAIGKNSIPIYEVGPQRVLSKFLATLNIPSKAITDIRSLEKTFGSEQ